jgi:putative redox protein
MATQSHKVTFPGSLGTQLAARLDLPDGPVRAYALFAHCFTCSKDIFAAARIAAALTEHGIAVLRFDFTGLGASEGEFANTNFSSNVADLLKAADYLRTNHSAPKILIGHSLGGAAVLAAAGDVPEATAVATIAAPAEASHVVHNFGAKLDEIAETGMAEVSLAGRSFTIRKQFLDDLEEHRLARRIAALKRALIVFHAPRDVTVGIENAAAIFTAAKHPKSFISLDDADHLLSRREDAVYVASILSAWVSRYIDEAATTATADVPKESAVAVAETGAGRFQQRVTAGRHRLFSDEPVSAGGLDTGLSPYDFLGAALGACTSMTMRLYAERKNIPATGFAVRVSHGKVHAEDCADCGEGRQGRIDRFERIVTIEGNIGHDDRTKLMEIADKCPVHRTLEASSVIVTRAAGDLTQS